MRGLINVSERIEPILKADAGDLALWELNCRK